jgi:hypothetical protein
MSAAKPKAPSTHCGHAGAAIACVHDGRGTIGIMIMVMIIVHQRSFHNEIGTIELGSCPFPP